MEFLQRFELDPQVLRWAVWTAVGLGVASLVVLPILVMAIPRDYFHGPAAPHPPWTRRYPMLHMALRIVRNALGAALVLLGVVMVVTPGQGLLTILVGLMLIEFPGKRRLERRLIVRRPIHRHLNWIRGLAGRPPLTLPDGTRGNARCPEESP